MTWYTQSTIIVEPTFSTILAHGNNVVGVPIATMSTTTEPHAQDSEKLFLGNGPGSGTFAPGRINCQGQALLFRDGIETTQNTDSSVSLEYLFPNVPRVSPEFVLVNTGFGTKSTTPLRYFLTTLPTKGPATGTDGKSFRVDPASFSCNAVL